MPDATPGLGPGVGVGESGAILFFSAVSSSAARADEEPGCSRTGLRQGVDFGIATDMAHEAEPDEDSEAKVY